MINGKDPDPEQGTGSRSIIQNCRYGSGYRRLKNYVTYRPDIRIHNTDEITTTKRTGSGLRPVPTMTVTDFLMSLTLAKLSWSRRSRQMGSPGVTDTSTFFRCSFVTCQQQGSYLPFQP